MRKVLWGTLSLAVVAIFLFFARAPGIVERGMNKVEPVALEMTPRARALHAKFEIADMHADTLLYGRATC